jgi:hypothetical protein
MAWILSHLFTQRYFQTPTIQISGFNIEGICAFLYVSYLNSSFQLNSQEPIILFKHNNMQLSTFKQQSIVAFEAANEEILNQIIGRDITDRFFCFIQNSREWMKYYLDTVSECGLQTVNSQMTQYICEHYGLQNSGVEQHHPYSYLIQSYHELIP